jgi:poly(beta-D-mannuronate) lyase
VHYVPSRRPAVVGAVVFLLPVLFNSCAGPVDETQGPVDEGSVVETEVISADPEFQSSPTVSSLNPDATPDDNFDLSHWKLTLPSGREIQAAELNDGYTLAGTFFTDPASGGMVFRCPNIASTTANSSFSRTELREMLAPAGRADADENNWTTADGGHLTARLMVDRVSTTGSDSKVGRVIVGQIHGPSTEVIRLYYDKKPDEARGRIYAGLDSIDNVNSWSPDIVSNMDDRGISLGERFTYQIRLSGRNLTVIVEPKSGGRFVYTKTIDAGYVGKNLYFKAGVYNQNNTGDAEDYAQATFFRLEHTH